MSMILIILLILLVLGALPTWGYSSSWGWSPVGIIVVLVILYLVFGSGRF